MVTARRAAQGGAVLVMVLVLMLAGALLSAAVAASAAMETAMAGQAAETAQAFSAAQAGVAAALRSRDWGPGAAWSGAGALGDAAWRAGMTLAAASVGSGAALPEWHFEIVSTGVAGRASATVVQGFVVAGALPGEPELTYWRQAAPDP